MDILSARKKAAAKKKTKKKAKTDPAQTIPPVPVEEALPPSAGPKAPVAQAAEAVLPAERSLPSCEEVSEEPVPVTDEEGEEIEEHYLDMLAFRLGNEEYIVTMEQVREVLKRIEATPLPNTPDHILGVITIRGTVLPVIDLCKRLGIAAGIRDEKSRIVVVSIDDEKTGLLVERVMGVVKIKEDIIRPAPETIEQGAGAEFLRGIARKDEQLYVLLDLEKAVGT